MIYEAELRRWAGMWSIDPMIVDMDYALGCFLSQWYQNEIAAGLRFKGGTCIRKCYLSDYRFSEDLDFTVEIHISQDNLLALLNQTIHRVFDVFGINLEEKPSRFDVVNDEYGAESYEIRLYYRGPLRWQGDPRAIRLDISHEEYLGLPAVSRAIIHPYSDKTFFSDITIPCYSLAEMLAEKIRALGGQRKYAISRDLYDVHHLIHRGRLAIKDVQALLPGKFAVKKLKPEALNPKFFESRKYEFKRDWERNLVHLLPSSDKTTFNEAWETCFKIIQFISAQP